MNIYQKAHLTLKGCNNLNFFNQVEIENCQAVWTPIQIELEKNNSSAIADIQELEESIRESIKYLSLMFGKGKLLDGLQ